ncbi:MAG TPA: DUF4132 domain-containing protein [Candidatus Eremiobacteraeota bacterium]|nr:MAG: hypothetical protein BWY64_01946 [bacterium ADurb.Bin363]HPZ08546.1 DUF4132 domain-containing protein [Candidatus Eremiobacteraeota bacterium]
MNILNIESLLLDLRGKLSRGFQEKLDKISIETDNEKLLKFLSELYPKSEEDLLLIIKDIFISLAQCPEDADKITDIIVRYLNHPGQIIRSLTLEIIYEFYQEKFTPSVKKARVLSLGIIDCLAVTTKESPELELKKGYLLLRILGSIYPDEVFPLLYRALKDKSHPCRMGFMEIFAYVNFESFVWLERLIPYLIDFFTSEDDTLILAASRILKKQFPHFPCLLGRFILPVLNLMERGSYVIQDALSEVIFEISATHMEFLTDVVTILIDYIKNKDKSEKSIILIVNSLNNLSGNKRDIDNIIKIIMKKSPSPVELSDRNKIWLDVSKKILEQAMITQEKFTVKEFIWLFGEEVFKEILSRLVLNLYGERGSFLGIYHEKNWFTAEGKVRFAHTKQLFTVAHPLDIFFANQIILWQKIIMERKIKQPFQQVFRSLFSLHMDEITEIESLRYFSQKLIPDKAKKSFIYEGFCMKENYIFYNWKDPHIQVRFIWDREKSAHKGISITGQIQFYKILDLKSNIIDNRKIPLWQIEPRIFSESIRKLELIISKSIFRK